MHITKGLPTFRLMSPRSNRTPSTETQETPRPFLPWLGRACRQAREQKGVVQVQIAAALKVNQATIARFEDGTAWPRRPEEVLMAYASELKIDVRLLWLHAFLLWLENEPVLDEESQEEIRAALRRVAPPEDAG
jgi:transcriptional regulator with XRE-family HTH domain